VCGGGVTVCGMPVCGRCECVWGGTRVCEVV